MLTKTMGLARKAKQCLHLFWEEHFTYPSRPGSKALPNSIQLEGVAQDPEQLLSSLRTEGIFTLPGLIAPSVREKIHEKMEGALRGEIAGVRIEDSAESHVRYIENPLMLGTELLQLALNPFIVETIEAYFQADAYLAEVDMRRVLPISMDEFEAGSGRHKQGYTSSHWHYDVRGRQVKVMYYLSDVGPEDQNFAYIPRSHLTHPLIPRSRIDYSKSRFPEGWPEKNGFKVVECYAKAGTAVVFDTNCVHRLRRKKSRIRDSLTFYYTPGQELRKLEYRKEDLPTGNEAYYRIFGGKR